MKKTILFLTVLLAAVTAQAQYTGNFQTNTISGVTSNWAGPYHIGSINNGYTRSDFNGLIVTNAGKLFITGVLYDGDGVTNSVLVTGAGSLLSSSGSCIVGDGGTGNHLTIENGGFVYSGSSGIIGNNYIASASWALVTGAGSIWSNNGALFVCNHGQPNTLTIANGGKVYDSQGYIGYPYDAANSNAVVVTGAGSVWSNSSALFVGNVGWGNFDNTLTISNGGTVVATATEIAIYSALILSGGTLVGNLSIDPGALATGGGTYAGAVTNQAQGTLTPGGATNYFTGPASSLTLAGGSTNRFQVGSAAQHGLSVANGLAYTGTDQPVLALNLQAYNQGANATGAVITLYQNLGPSAFDGTTHWFTLADGGPDNGLNLMNGTSFKAVGGSSATNDFTIWYNRQANGAIGGSNIVLTVVRDGYALVQGLANPPGAGTVGGGGAYLAGANIQLTAAASNGWVFTGWSDGATNNPCTLTVPATNSTYTANFAPTALLTVGSSTNVGGSVTGGGTFAVGSTNQIAATASNGWLFIQWSDGVTNNPRSVVVTEGGAAYTANFSQLGTVSTLAIPVNGGSTTGDGTYLVGSNISIMATASNNWLFTGWNDGATNNPYTITVPPTDITYTANFAAAATVTVEVNTNAGGSVTGGGTYFVGSNVLLTATASNGWAFTGWSDGILTNQYTLTVPATNSTYAANFAALATLTVGANTNAGGSVTGGGTFLMGSTNQIAATASNGWLFIQWSDGVTNNPRSVVVTEGGANYTADFTNAPSAPATAQLFFQNGDGLVASWLLATNGSFEAACVLGSAGAWQLMTAGDMNGDGVSDLLFQDATGNTAGWLLDTTGTVRRVINWGNVGGWEVRACADYKGEGHDQIFFQLPNGLTALWHIDTNGVFQSAEMVLTNASDWRLSAASPHVTGGRADLYWQNAAGLVVVWRQKPGGVLAQVVGNADAWVLCGAADLDGDGVGDLLWQTPDGNTAGWFMSSTNTARACLSWGHAGDWKLKAGGQRTRAVR